MDEDYRQREATAKREAQRGEYYFGRRSRMAGADPNKVEAALAAITEIDAHAREHE